MIDFLDRWIDRFYAFCRRWIGWRRVVKWGPQTFAWEWGTVTITYEKR